MAIVIFSQYPIYRKYSSNAKIRWGNEQIEDARGRREAVREEGEGRRGDEGVVATYLWIGHRRSSGRRRSWAGGAVGGFTAGNLGGENCFPWVY